MNTTLKVLSLAFIVSIGLSSCKNGTLPSGTAPPDYGFFALIDGDTVSIYSDGVFISSGSSWSTSDDSLSNEWLEGGSSMFQFGQVEQAGLTIQKSFVDGYDPGIDDLDAMYSVGSYDWGRFPTGFNDYGVAGAVVYYVDEAGTSWRSDGGTQTASSFFRITKLSTQTDASQFADKILEASFQCTLYDGQGASVQLTNGSAKLNAVTNF